MRWRAGKPVVAETELERRMADLEQRLRASEADVHRLHGRVEAMADAQRAQRAAFDGEMQRLVEWVRGTPGTGLEAFAAQLAERAAPEAAAEREARVSRYEEIHGAGISQEEMIARIRKRNGRDEAPTGDG